MARVVQDSDEELDDESLEDAPPQLPNQNASPNSKPSQRDPDTGSTDSLKRNIEAAHRAQFHTQTLESAPTPSFRQPDGESLGSLSEHTSKRRKTTVETSPTKTPTDGRRRKTPIKTYGRSKSSFPSMLGEQNQILLESPFPNAGVFADVQLGLQSTMQKDYADHDPMVLFPEGSITQPDGTATQQRLLEKALAPAFLGIEAEEGLQLLPLEPEKSSVPWSDFLKSTADDASAENRANESQEHTDTPINQSTNKSQSPKVSPQYDGSQRSRRDSAPKVSPLRNEIQLCNALATEYESQVHDGDVSTDQKKARRSDNTSQSDTASAPRSSKSMLKLPSSPLESPDDELNDIGLSKENYQPRPSRSRSLRIMDETPIDYSANPDRVAKKKQSKRSKTVGGIEAIPPTPQKVQQICDMGFTPRTTLRALENSGGDVRRSVEWLVNNDDDGEDELAPSPKPSNSANTKRQNKKNSSQRSQDVEALEDKPAPTQQRSRKLSFSAAKEHNVALSSIPEETITNVEQQQKPSAAMQPPPVPAQLLENKHPKVVIPSPKPKATISFPDAIEIRPQKADTSQKLDMPDATSAKKTKRRKTTLDLPESTVEVSPMAVDITPTQTTKDKKRGRGRPRKDPNASKSSDPAPEIDIAAKPPPQTGNQDVPQTEALPSALQDKEPNILPAPKTSEIQTKTEDPPASTPPLNISTSASKDSKTPEKQAQSGGATAHSPINKGKVPYRVGLSRRARITPLLRVVKK